MCGPVAGGAAVAALGIAESVSTHIQQSKMTRQAKRDARYRFEQTKALLEADLRSQQRSLSRLALEQDQLRAAELQDVTRESLRQLGLTRVSAAASGAAGNAVAELIRNAEGQQAQARFRSGRGGQFEDLAFQDQSAAQVREFQGRLLSIQPDRISNPSQLQLGLNIVGAGLKGYSAYRGLSVG